MRFSWLNDAFFLRFLNGSNSQLMWCVKRDTGTQGCSVSHVCETGNGELCGSQGIGEGGVGVVRITREAGNGGAFAFHTLLLQFACLGLIAILECPTCTMLERGHYHRYRRKDVKVPDFGFYQTYCSLNAIFDRRNKKL